MSSQSLLSRFAENHFWLARYVERAENLARILDVNETFARDRTGVQEWLPIVQLHADDESFFEKHDEANAKTVVHFYLMDRDNPNSIIESVRAARENARSLRHLVSIELWTQLNVFYRWLEGLKWRDYDLRNLSRLCGEITQKCQLHTGIVEGTMFRDQALAFYLIGKQLERADQLTRLVDIKYHRLLPRPSDIGSPVDVSQWNAMLRSVAGYQAFRRTHPSGMTPALVAGFLLFNPGFSRSLKSCIRETRKLVNELIDNPALEGTAFRPQSLDKLERQVTISIDDVIDRGVHEFLDDIQLELIELGREMAEAYFDQESPPQQTQQQTQG